jgi:RHS repeat-associated protein
MRSNVESRGIEVRQDRTNAAFPGDALHGNAKALLNRSGSSFSTTAWRHYDVWGSLRAGSALGGASQRCCANLGHVADDESGLVYMRARFYEPWTGRFVSENPAMDRRNWHVYANNSPVVSNDPDGMSADEVAITIDFLFKHANNVLSICFGVSAMCVAPNSVSAQLVCLAAFTACIAWIVSDHSIESRVGTIGAYSGLSLALYVLEKSEEKAAKEVGKKYQASVKDNAISAITPYGYGLMVFLSVAHYDL